METLYDMHCHLGFAPDPAVTAAAGARAGIRAFSCTVSPAEYAQLQPLLGDEATAATGTVDAAVTGAAVAGTAAINVTATKVALGLGAHPWWIADGHIGTDELDTFCETVRTTRLIGEIGLDFAPPRDTEESRAAQLAAFERILSACDEPPSTAIAAANGNPCDSKGGGFAQRLLSIHAVRAAGDVLDRLEAAGTLERHRVIFHWFSGTSDELARAIRAGCFFSVGPRMLASRRGREYARRIPPSRLLLETDMPSRAGDTLAANVWRAELGNALAGIAQLESIDHAELAATVNATSKMLLGF